LVVLQSSWMACSIRLPAADHILKSMRTMASSWRLRLCSRQDASNLCYKPISVSPNVCEPVGFCFVVTNPGLPDALISPTRLDRQPAWAHTGDVRGHFWGGALHRHERLAPASAVEQCEASVGGCYFGCLPLHVPSCNERPMFDIFSHFLAR